MSASLEFSSIVVNAAVALGTFLVYYTYLAVQSSWGSHQQNLQTINQNIIRNGSVTEAYRKELDTKIEELNKVTLEAKNLIALLVNYFNSLETARQQNAGENAVAEKNPVPATRSVQLTRPDSSNVRNVQPTEVAPANVQQYIKPVAAPAAPVVEATADSTAEPAAAAAPAKSRK